MTINPFQDITKDNKCVFTNICGKISAQIKGNKKHAVFVNNAYLYQNVEPRTWSLCYVIF